MVENMPVPEFNEKEIELINALKEKGFCPEVRALFCAWQDAEQQKPEWEEARRSKENTSLVLQAGLDLKKAKILIEAGLNEDADEALSAVDLQIAQAEDAGIDCTELRNQMTSL